MNKKVIIVILESLENVLTITISTYIRGIFQDKFIIGTYHFLLVYHHSI